MTGSKLAIMELVSKYLRCLDERRFDAEAFAEIFTDGAEVVLPSNLVSGRECRGLHEIRDVHATLFRQTKASFHTSSDYIFSSITEDNAEARCRLLAYYDSFSIEAENTLALGEISISATLTDEGWRIRRMKRSTGYFGSLTDRAKSK